jgi:putative DNA primase/helicase
MRDLLVSADASRVLAFDNVSFIDQQLSDAMCRLATGVGVQNRSLYADRSLSVFEQIRSIFINGIELADLRGDLVDRAVPIGLVRIPERDRKTEKAVQARFDALLPRILGGLFSTVAEAWANIPEINLEILPRMADAAVWFAAVDAAFQDRGVESRSLELLSNSKRALFQTIVESDDLAMLVVSVAGRCVDGSWSGTASELRNRLLEVSDAAWSPPTASVLGSKLRSSATALREAGLLDIAFIRSGTERTIRITDLSKAQA